MSTKYVRIYFGPVESFNLSAEYKPQFLFGIRRRLRRLGYRVDLVPTKHINYCMIAMCGYMIFHCNIKSLSFNAPIQNDPVCRNAVEAVVDATKKLQRTRTYLWAWSVVEGQCSKTAEYSPKEYWVSDIPPLPEELPDFQTCLKCCGILTKKKTEDDCPEEAPTKD